MLLSLYHHVQVVEVGKLLKQRSGHGLSCGPPSLSHVLPDPAPKVVAPGQPPMEYDQLYKDNIDPASSCTVLVPNPPQGLSNFYK